MCSDGFTTAALPQKTAGNAFHATFGRGVLKLITSAATPSGCRVVSTVRWRHARGRRAPVRAPPLACDEQAHLDGRVGLAECELERLAGLLDDDRGRFVAAFTEEEREVADDVATGDGS